MQKLYNLGARKFVLMSVNPIGCSPMVAANRPVHKTCVQGLNKAAHLFNARLKSLGDVIKPDMPGSNFVYVNSYKIIRDIIRNPISKGKYNMLFLLMENDKVKDIHLVIKFGSGSLCYLS